MFREKIRQKRGTAVVTVACTSVLWSLLTTPVILQPGVSVNKYVSYKMKSWNKHIYMRTITDAYNLQRTIGARPVPPVQPHYCWLLNPYMVTDRAAFGS